MLTPEQNEYVTRTGPGTPMGQLFRSYWIPALLSEELAENDGPPVRCELLGEKLIAFRDTNGHLGLIEEFCAHRRVSLWFGRNEECGLRCPYHGWKFDVTGQCVDIPSEPAGSEHYKKIKMRGYPLSAMDRLQPRDRRYLPSGIAGAARLDHYPLLLQPSEVAASSLSDCATQGGIFDRKPLSLKNGPAAFAIGDGCPP